MLLCPDLVLFDVWYIKEACFLWAGKIKGSVHISDCLYLLTKLYTCEVKLKIEDAVHRDIELNRIDDMIIVIEPNCKISVGSHPYWTQRKIFCRMWETEQFWGTIDFHSIFFLTMEVNGAPKLPRYKLSSKYLPLCLAEQRRSYRFGNTGWVNDDTIFIFGWIIHLTCTSKLT